MGQGRLKPPDQENPFLPVHGECAGLMRALEGRRRRMLRVRMDPHTKGAHALKRFQGSCPENCERLEHVSQLIQYAIVTNG
jgi:hypothetical protein